MGFGGFFDSLVEGVGSAVTTISKTADAVGQVADVMGKIGKIVPQHGAAVLGLDDGPLIEVLRRNAEVATNVLLDAAEKELKKVHDSEDIKVSSVQSTAGIFLNRRVRSLDSPQAPSSKATPVMYSDMASLLSQLGVPLQGKYPKEDFLRDNAKVVTDTLFLNDKEVDPNSPNPIDTSNILLRDEHGKPFYKMAHANYRLKLDKTGLNDISHSALSYGPTSNRSAWQIANDRKKRHDESEDVVTKPPAASGPTLPGYSVVADIKVRDATKTRELAKGLKELAPSVHWLIESLLEGGSYITLSILTPGMPIAISDNIIDWLLGSLGGSPAPPQGISLEDVRIVSALPAVVPGAGSKAKI